MSYYRYARATRDHIIELFRSITRDEYLNLAGVLENMGESDWFSWQAKNLKDTLAFLRATPAERGRKKKWQDPATKILLKYSAYIEANKAYSLLYAIGVYDLPAGIPYREMTVAAVKGYYHATSRYYPDWPFDCDHPAWMKYPRQHYGDDYLTY